MDRVLDLHTKSQYVEGTVPLGLKDVIVNTVRIMYHTWTEDVQSDSLFDISCLLRSLFGAAITQASISGVHQFSKNLDFYT